MQKRTNKFYRKNEAELMKRIGLKPTINSGSGWIEKEDGENETLICQLKSTDADSIKINLLDLQKLFYHANISHKTGVFIIQFLNTNEEYIMCKREDVCEVAQGLLDGQEYNFIADDKSATSDITVRTEAKVKNTIKSGSKNARNKFYAEREKNYNGKRKN
jgi:hypothetical protein